MTLSAIIITLNEETNMKDCLASVSFCDEIIVVDSGSRDKTVEIAKRFNAKVFIHPFRDFSEQKNFALSKAEGEWVLSLDADERVSEALKDEIVRTTKRDRSKAVGYRIPRQTYYLGKRFRFSGTQNDKPLRLFKRNAGQFMQPIHEYFAASGAVSDLLAPLVHRSTATIQQEIQKTEFYTDIETRFLMKRGRQVGNIERTLRGLGIFGYHYVWKLGFLDGREGFLYARYARLYTLAKYRKLSDEQQRRDLEKKIGTRFDEHAPRLPETIDPADRRLNALLQACGDVRGKKVLEVGCGKGRFTAVMADRGADVTGIDPSETLLQDARRNVSSGRFLQGSATELPFDRDSFDVAYAVEVIEHLPFLRPAIAEMARVLKPGGVLVLVDRNKRSMNHQRFMAPNVLIKRWHELKNDWMYPRNFPFRERWFTRNQVTEMMQPLFRKVTAAHILSDGEKNCAWSWSFERFPYLRLFILWRGEKK